MTWEFKKLHCNYILLLLFLLLKFLLHIVQEIVLVLDGLFVCWASMTTLLSHLYTWINGTILQSRDEVGDIILTTIGAKLVQERGKTWNLSLAFTTQKTKDTRNRQKEPSAIYSHFIYYYLLWTISELILFSMNSTSINYVLIK